MHATSGETQTPIVIEQFPEQGGRVMTCNADDFRLRRWLVSFSSGADDSRRGGRSWNLNGNRRAALEIRPGLVGTQAAQWQRSGVVANYEKFLMDGKPFWRIRR